MIFVYFNFLTGFTGLTGLLFIFSHFPDGSEKTQSACSGIKGPIKLFIL
jgi:hypothetical protein